MENECRFVSINGIAKSCDVYPNNIIHNSNEFDEQDYINIKNGNSVFVVTNCIEKFSETVLPRLKDNNIKIKLVTGASDIGVPNNLDSVDNKNYLSIFGDVLIHWFCQNYDNDELLEEYTCIPLGLDFHTDTSITPKEQERLLTSIYKKGESFSERLPRCLSTFQFRLVSDKNQDKWKAMEALNELEFNDVLKERKDRQKLWEIMTKYRFIICPFSTGIDTHRIYESILLGCVPIVKRSPISYMLTALPVLIIDDWTDLTPTRWNIFKDFHAFRKFEKDTAKLEYWVELIKEK